jgi:hypothetical protein
LLQLRQAIIKVIPVAGFQDITGSKKIKTHEQLLW